MQHHKISSEWRWNHWPLSGNDGIAKIFLEEASPLVADNDWHNDIVGFESLSDLTITIELLIGDKSQRRNESAKDQALNDQILPYVSHATVVFVRKNGEKLGEHLWFNIFLLSKALASRSPNLTTLTIVAQASKNVTDGWSISSKSAAPIDFFPSPYMSLAGLPLRSCPGQDEDHSHYATMGDNLGVERPPHVRMDSGMGVRRVVRKAIWVYANDGC
jgi:hypothetical protein